MLVVVKLGFKRRPYKRINPGLCAENRDYVVCLE